MSLDDRIAAIAAAELARPRSRAERSANIDQALCDIGRGGCPEEGYDSTTGDLERVVNMIWDFIKAESSKDEPSPAAAQQERESA